MDGSSIVIDSCFILLWELLLWLIKFSSEFFLCIRFFLIGLLESIAAAANSADERFFDTVFSIVSTPIDEVRTGGGGFGVVFSNEIFDNPLWWHLRTLFPFDDESYCS